MPKRGSIAIDAEPLPPRRSPEWFAALGFRKPFGMKSANWWNRMTFGWGAPLLDTGTRGQIIEEMADCLPPPEDEAPLRAQQFASCHDQCQVWRLPPSRLDCFPARLP